MLYSWIYVFVNALSALLRQVGGNELSPAVILFIGCCCAVIYFHVVNLGKIKLIYRQCCAEKRDWFALSLSVALVWVCSIYGPSYIGASLYTFLYFSIFGAMGFIGLYRIKVSQSSAQLISILGILVLLILIIGKNVVEHCTLKEMLGIILSVIGSTMGFVYSKQSSRFMKTTSLSASQVLAVRFFLAIAFSLILIPPHPFAHMDLHNFLLVLLIAAFCLIVPLYFVQKGIEKAGPEINAIICSTTPFIAAILEEIYFHDVKLENFAIFTLYIFFAAMPYVAKQLRHLNVNRDQVAKATDPTS